MEIITCEQNSPEWFEARRGIPTASMFATVMAKGRGGGESKTRTTYMMKLAGEIMTGNPMDNYSNADMQRGHDMEAEARDAYAFMTDSEPDQIGFVKNGNKGASPDALVGESGMVEIKSKAPHLQIEWMLKGAFPPAHKAQCQGQLWVAEREWVDLVGYCTGLPIFIVRAHRDEIYIAQMAKAVDQFNDELADMVETVRAYGSAASEAAE